MLWTTRSRTFWFHFSTNKAREQQGVAVLLAAWA